MHLFKGLQYNIQGTLLALKTPKLLVLGLLRFVVTLIFTLVLSGLVLYWHEQILALLWARPETGWMVWVWTAVSWGLSLVLAGIAMVLAYLTAQLLFCVFIMDLMSRITERMVSGKEQGPDNSSWFSFLIYLIKQEIPRAVIPVLITLTIMLLGLFTPVGPVVLLVSSVAAAVFLAWDNTDLTPARRMIPFQERLGFLKHNLSFHIGFGLPFLVPWLNIVFLSFAPVGATLYFLDREAGLLEDRG